MSRANSHLKSPKSPAAKRTVRSRIRIGGPAPHRRRQETQASELTNGLGNLLDELARRCVVSLEQTIAELGLDLRHWLILLELTRCNGCKQSDLAASLATSSSSLADALADLERDGWIAKRGEPNDKRIRRLFLRPKALCLTKQLRKPLVDLSERMFRGLTDQELNLFTDALGRLKTCLGMELRLLEPGAQPATGLDMDPPLEIQEPVDQRLSILTLGVADVPRSRSFYEHALGWRAASASSEVVVFFDLGSLKLALFDKGLLARDSGMEPSGEHDRFKGVSLTHVVGSAEQVDRVLARVVSAGGKLVRSAQDVFWGGYSGYFVDPDGHAWEVAACTSTFTLKADGDVDLPSTEAIASEAVVF